MLTNDNDLTLLETREQLPLLLNRRGFAGTAVEVGVQNGAFSQWILTHWKGSLLISVDPWLEDTEGIYRDASNVPQSQQEINYRRTVARLGRFHRRSQIWRMTSKEASLSIPDCSVDFVYLDARHDYESVSEDLHLWYPKVRSGGLFSGHDYLDGSFPHGVFGVKTAVDEFFRARNLSVYVTKHDRLYPSWVVGVPVSQSA